QGGAACGSSAGASLSQGQSGDSVDAEELRAATVRESETAKKAPAFPPKRATGRAKLLLSRIAGLMRV
ncbi:MAG: hypothetical protein ACKPJD_03790, partial [Planctomycetaceae bacterium]